MLLEAKDPFDINGCNRAVLELAEVGTALAIDGAARGGLVKNFLRAGNDMVDVGEGFHGLLTYTVV